MSDDATWNRFIELDEQKADREEDFMLQHEEWVDKVTTLGVSSCSMPQIFEFPYSSMRSEAANLTEAKQQLRQTLFLTPTQVSKESKNGNWPYCKKDSYIQHEISAIVENDDDGSKIILAWIACPGCYKP